jgi:hypothetical protein
MISGINFLNRTSQLLYVRSSSVTAPSFPATGQKGMKEEAIISEASSIIHPCITLD